jgi:hypothetical protein
MTIMVENVEPRGGHLHHEGLTAPLRLSVLAVKDKVSILTNLRNWLPYAGRNC